jgi:hypothetical protein
MFKGQAVTDFISVVFKNVVWMSVRRNEKFGDGMLRAYLPQNLGRSLLESKCHIQSLDIVFRVSMSSLGCFLRKKCHIVSAL